MSGLTTFASAAQALAASLLAATTDPSDSVRMLATLANFAPNAPVPASAVGTSMQIMQAGCGDLFRRAALIALARASASYQPSSFDDAVAIRNQLYALLDAEILIAGNQGEDGTFNAFRAVRAAVVQDLTTRAADLSMLATVKSNSSVPAPVLAQRLYRDSTRADELVVQCDPPHPAFMPITFKALSQ
jgi:prophage DNA circulation protein